MQLRYDEDFVEAAVLLVAAGRLKPLAPFQVARFSRQRERLYDILEPDERNTAFFRLHIEWFREWGLESLLTEPLKRFPLLSKALDFLAFRKSRGKDDEGAELYVNETGHRNGVMAMRPERFARKTELGAFLHHELTHLYDMVDPAFGYQPDIPIANPSLSQHRLARERYRLLWDVSIDGRLTCGGWGTIAAKDQRASEFAAAFAFWPEERQRNVFESLWTNPSPSHQLLLELVCQVRQPSESSAPGPGGQCPLCGFPTFAWADLMRLSERTISAIRAEHWTPDRGACARCAQIYSVDRQQFAMGV